MGATLGLISSGLSLAGGIGGMFGGKKGGAGGSMPPQWQMPNMNEAAGAALQGTGNLAGYNNYGQTMGLWQQALGNLYNNPEAGGYRAGSAEASAIGRNTGLGQVNAGNALMGAGQALLPWAQDILKMGFDPQKELYGRTADRVTDASRAALAARGIQMSPYGAGVENEAFKNFNIDWENNLLSRANQAAQGAGYLTNSGGNAINLGQNVGTLGVGQLERSAALPYNVEQLIGLNQMGALDQYGKAGIGAAQIPQMQIENYLKYLGIGNQANSNNNTAYGMGLQRDKMLWDQQQAYGKGVGSGLEGIGKWWGGTGNKWFQDLGGGSGGGGSWPSGGAPAFPTWGF